jgi:adenylyltransferase/sulfurtransferase
MSATPDDPSLRRYARQIRFASIGEDGQRKLLASRALVCGCGALGSAIAGTLVRSGVGNVRIVDRDFLELNNLQRQVLFDEDDVAHGLPKAIAASQKLARINSEVSVEPIVADVTSANVELLTDGVDVILDGTDNFETRFLLNDVALKRGIPWVFGGCIGSEGQTMTVLPHVTPCLRCLMHEPPSADATPTCDTAGILAPIVSVVAAIQSQEAIKILSGRRDAIQPGLIVIDLWNTRLRQVGLAGLGNRADCPACSGREYPWLAGERGSSSVVLCGRNAVQVSSRDRGDVSLAELEQRLMSVGRVTRNAFLLRASIDDYVLTVFADGRAIIGGTDDPVVARSVYAKYIGM